MIPYVIGRNYIVIDQNYVVIWELPRNFPGITTLFSELPRNVAELPPNLWNYHVTSANYHLLVFVMKMRLHQVPAASKLRPYFQITT